MILVGCRYITLEREERWLVQYWGDVWIFLIAIVYEGQDLVLDTPLLSVGKVFVRIDRGYQK
jgi:hypothetical protein